MALIVPCLGSKRLELGFCCPVFAAESGDSDEERGVHALLSLAVDLPDEHLFLRIRHAAP